MVIPHALSASWICGLLKAPPAPPDGMAPLGKPPAGREPPGSGEAPAGKEPPAPAGALGRVTPAALRHCWTAERLPLATPACGETAAVGELDAEAVGVLVGVDVFELLQAARLPTQTSEAALIPRVRVKRIVVLRLSL